MLFYSATYLLWFLPLVLAGLYLIGRTGQGRLVLGWLLLASIVFYAWREPLHLIVLALSVLTNYWLGAQIAGCRTADPRRAKLLVGLGVAANLALLGYFKYTGFLAQTANLFPGVDLPVPAIALPLGVSFYTFTQTAFLVDVYRGEAAEPNLLRYGAFVTFFPCISLGPIMRACDCLPKFRDATLGRWQTDRFAVGLGFFLVGMIKKTVLADPLASYVGPVFGAAANHTPITFFEAWGAILAYAFQLYFDFSGYSDMAIGAGRLIGLEVPLNFDSPYRATSIIDFWRRWHITLSQFLLRYLYIPLGGNRLGEWRRQINLMVTMLLGGLWHGAGWTFVFWGGLHGAYLVINHSWRNWRGVSRKDAGPGPLPARIAGTALTFLAVLVAWVFFRAPTLASATGILRGMLGLNGVVLPEQVAAAVPGLSRVVKTAGTMPLLGGGSVMGVFEMGGLIVASGILVFACPPTHRMRPWLMYLAVAAGAAFAIQAIFFSRAVPEFVYFQF